MHEPQKTQTERETLLSRTIEPSYTIPEFCAAERITTPTYYKLKKRGLGPREMRNGATIRISHSARLDWQRARENPTGAEAAEVTKAAAELRERSHAAAKRAVTSPNHISARRRAGQA